MRCAIGVLFPFPFDQQPTSKTCNNKWVSSTMKRLVEQELGRHPEDSISVSRFLLLNEEDVTLFGSSGDDEVEPSAQMDFPLLGFNQPVMD